MALKKLLIGLLITPLVAGAIAAVLVASQWPQGHWRAAASGAVGPPAAAMFATRQTYLARDGASLGYLSWGSREAGDVIVALHGSGGHAGWMSGLAASLAEATDAQVVAPDLRGHGPSARHRGDLAYIGQLEDDLVDLIEHLGRVGRRVVLLGHSGGGGLVIRFAGSGNSHLIDQAVLVAPFLQHDAPTMLPAPVDGWARPLTRRIAGLFMLNAAGINAFNDLTVVQFRYPPALLEGPAAPFATTRYSYRMQFSLMPRRDWKQDVAALPPFLLVAGAQDNIFSAVAYEPTLAPLAPQGRFLVVDGAGHADILEAQSLVTAVADFLGAED